MANGYTIQLHDQVVHVDGHDVGYQFNKKSLGNRILSPKSVWIIQQGDKRGIIKYLGREVRVRNFGGRHWETY